MGYAHAMIRRHRPKSVKHSAGIALLVSAGAGACADDGACDNFSASDATTLTTSALRLSDVAPVALIADESGTYWRDSRDIVFGLPRGSSAPVELYRKPQQAVGGPYQVVLGLVADATQLYLGDVFIERGGDAYTLPDYGSPARVLAIPKGGGEPKVVIALSSGTITPLAVGGDRIIAGVTLDYRGGVYAVDKQSGALTDTPAQPPLMSGARQFGEAFYWTMGVGAEYELWRWGFEDVTPAVVTRLDTHEYDLAPGLVLSRKGPVIGDPAFTWDADLVVYDEARSCNRVLPSAGAGVSFPTFTDESHVYWLGGPYYAEQRPLMRASLSDGSVEVLNIPGFEATSLSGILGGSAEHVYISSDDGLVAILKP